MRPLPILALCLFAAVQATAQSTLVITDVEASFGEAGATATATLYTSDPLGCEPNDTEPNYGTITIDFTNNSTSQSCSDFLYGPESLSVSCGTPAFVNPGNYAVSATYSGFSGFDSHGNSCYVPGATASGGTVNVPQDGDTTSVDQFPSLTLQAGQILSLPVTVFGGEYTEYYSYLPTGKVEIAYNGLDVGATPVQPIYDGVDTYSTATINQSTKGIPPGNYTATVAYTGDQYFSPSSSAPFTVTILAAQLATSTSFTATPNPIVANQPITLTAEVSPAGVTTPTGYVTFIAGATTIGSAKIVNYTATLTGPANVPAGTYNVQALYGGDAFNLASTSTPVQVVVDATSATTTTLQLSPSALVSGQSGSATATVKAAVGDTPTGTVTLLVNGSPASTLALSDGSAALQYSSKGLANGSYSVVAKYSGSATDLASTSTASTLTIAPGSVLTLTASPNPVAKGSITTLTATVKTGTGSPITSGTVTFSYGGSSLGSATLTTSGTAQLPIETTGFAAGTYAIQATYPGAGSVPSASGTVNLTVN